MSQFSYSVKTESPVVFEEAWVFTIFPMGLYYIPDGGTSGVVMVRKLN